jgi:signal transduction histidine kinase/tetratricopeptide (TPR) repeat protein
VFLATIVFPSILLAVFGLRALRQERWLVDQQIRQRLERATEAAAQSLEQELSEWEKELEQVGQPPAGESPMLPERIGRAVGEPGAAALVVYDGREWRASPPGQLLYAAAPKWGPARPPGRLPAIAEEAIPRAFAKAESLELVQKDYPKAIAVYRQLLEQVQGPRSKVQSREIQATPAAQAFLALEYRALFLHRLGRTYRKAGRWEEARRTYGQLLSLPQASVGELPADLVAKHELCRLWEEQSARDRLAACALELYRELVSGRWPIEKARYLFYSRQAKEWLAGPGDAAALQALEQQKLALTGAVELLMAAAHPAPVSAGSLDAGPLAAGRRAIVTDRGTHLALWRPVAKPTPPHSAFRVPHSALTTALVLRAGYLKGRVWPRVFAAAAAEGLEVCLLGADGVPLFGSPADARSTWTVTRNLDESGLPWRLQVRPRQPAVLQADLVRRQKLYLALFVAVMALLVFGSYLTGRTVRKELEIARLKSDFVSVVSHEFRSPLTSVRQLGEMLMRGRVPSEERRQQYYELITRESDRLARLMESVLDFSRMEEGRKQYRFEPLDATAWLRALAQDFQAEVAAQGVSIEAGVPDDLPLLVADREALTSAVQNLLDNAVKYSPGCKTVWLEAEPSDSSLIIRVRDRGIGIAEQDRKHIFEKFYRGGSETARRVKGVGLGLSLVKQIAAAHRGSVQVESRPGQGSTFTITLPGVTSDK